MRFEFDLAKSEKNERERGLPFTRALVLFGAPRIEWEDRRRDYGETRINTLGEIEGRVFFAAFIAIELRVPAPLVPLGIFRKRNVSVG